jgi:hypothetical protein
MPDNAPSALVNVLAQTPTHISRPPPKTTYCAHCPTPPFGVRQLSHVLHCPAPAHENSTTCAFPSAEVPAPRKSRQPLSSFAYPLTQNFNAIIARTTAATQGTTAVEGTTAATCPLFSNSSLDRPSCSSQNISLFALREYCWTGHKSGSGFSGITPATLGAWLWFKSESKYFRFYEVASN